MLLILVHEFLIKISSDFVSQQRFNAISLHTSVTQWYTCHCVIILQKEKKKKKPDPHTIYGPSLELTQNIKCWVDLSYLLFGAQNVKLKRCWEM